MLTAGGTDTRHAEGRCTPGDGLRCERVGFRYPGAEHPTLSDISLHLTPGMSLALVGENGSGKTTLIKLLTRLYTPDEGRILLDGSDLQDWDEQALHQRIGVIFPGLHPLPDDRRRKPWGGGRRRFR